MKRFQITWSKQRLSLALAVLPALFLLGLIIFNSVNVPYWDQWELVPVIQHVHSGHIYFHDFWAQQNEHRIFFPRIIMIISAFITGWNVRVESLISLVIASCSFIIIMKTLRITQRELKRKSLFLLPLLLSLIWFSPAQVENWLWGWQIQWFLSVFGVVLVTFGIARIKQRVLTYPNLLLLLTGGIIASYSLGNGVITWPLLVAALLYLRVPIEKTVIAAITGLLSTGLYYHHYINPSPHSTALISKEPVLFIKYVLVYLGRPLSFVHGLAPVLGLVLLFIFASLTTFIFVKKRRPFFSAVLPWVVLGLYAIGSSMVTAAARMGLGLDQAYNSSRYITISSLLLISTVIICIECRSVFKKWFGKKFKIVVSTSAVIIFALVLANVAWGIQATYKRSQFLKGEQTCTHATKPTDDCLGADYPYKPVIKQRLNYLKQIHWGGY